MLFHSSSESLLTSCCRSFSASGDQYLLVSGTIACTGWVICSSDSPYITHILSLAYLCLSVALDVLGYLGEFLLNPALSTLRIFSRLHLAEFACLSHLGQSLLVIDLESTVVVLSYWILNYSVPMRSDSSLLPSFLLPPSTGWFPQSYIEHIQNLSVLF